MNCKICGLVCWNLGKGLQGQRSGLPHAGGDVESPFEASDVRQIRQCLGGFKVSEEVGESAPYSTRQRECGGCSRRYSCAT